MSNLSIWTYYIEAIPRAFWHGWEWAEGQGIWLTIWWAVSAIVVELVRSAIRLRRSDNGGAMKGWIKTARETAIAVGGGVTVLVLGLFVWSFVQDAPELVGKLQAERDAAQRLSAGESDTRQKLQVQVGELRWCREFG
jgi:hypothetical protein